jgi:glycerate 2-kinase
MDLKNTARDIFLEAVRAADPAECIRNTVSLADDTLIIGDTAYTSTSFPKIIVIGGGKASARMGQALEEILGNRISGGWINTKYGHAVPLEHMTVHECGHPVPDEQGVFGTRHIIDLLERADEQTLVICLLSGGGSALMPAPADGITLEEKQTVTRLLLSAGANIGEINTIRKHLSRLKGGGMARLAAPATLHVLILSDVIGDPLDTIASGPAVADPGTFSDCLVICERYGMLEKLPSGVLNRFRSGASGVIPDTLKSVEIGLFQAENSIIGNNRLSVAAAETAARVKGFTPLVLSTSLQGEARHLGTFFGAIASEIRTTGNPVRPPACIIGSGETTVTIQGTGKGGRNQELALAAALSLQGMDHVAFLSGGTDGTDGPTDAAGGIVDGDTTARCRTAGYQPERALIDNDSYHCLQSAGDLLMTGPTGTNVMDIQILLAGI